MVDKIAEQHENDAVGVGNKATAPDFAITNEEMKHHQDLFAKKTADTAGEPKVEAQDAPKGTVQGETKGDGRGDAKGEPQTETKGDPQGEVKGEEQNGTKEVKEVKDETKGEAHLQMTALPGYDFGAGYPYEQFDPKPYIDKHATPEDKATFAEFDKLAQKTGGEPLTDDQKMHFLGRSPDEKEMFRTTMKDLEKFADGSITSSDYMSNTLRNAARLAEQNGREPGSWNIFKSSKEELFKDYIGMVFSRPSLGSVWKDAGRDLAGSPMHNLGSALEGTYMRLTFKNGNGDGFNPNVLDSQNPDDSVTHHLRELMLVGYNRGKWLADKATTQVDDPKVNPGDVRNGYYAGMLGDALEDGKLTPTEAAEMTIWAYTKHDGTQPPWGGTTGPENYINRNDYDINKWLEAFRKRQK